MTDIPYRQTFVYFKSKWTK